MTPRSIDLPGRVRLPYVEHGDPSDTPVILLHGVTDSWRSFEPPELLDVAVAESLNVPARVWRATFQSFLDDECREDPGRIVAPTLAVHEDAGHALHWEEPERFAAEVVAFARGLGPVA